jgi:hypothetical protein
MQGSVGQIIVLCGLPFSLRLTRRRRRKTIVCATRVSNANLRNRKGPYPVFSFMMGIDDL